MFTGIIEESGIAESINITDKSICLSVRATVCAEDIKVGNSVAVNGCCLTVTNIQTNDEKKLLTFDLLKETWNRTNFQFLTPKALVNLEKPLRANAELGGHFVTGHVEGLGKIIGWSKKGADWELDVQPPKELMKYIVYKGSIAVDGISLTIGELFDDFFRIWIIPHTYEVTALKERSVGSYVNLETDILGKYVERLLQYKKI